jgi:hypothetical protein
MRSSDSGRRPAVQEVDPQRPATNLRCITAAARPESYVRDRGRGTIPFRRLGGCPIPLGKRAQFPGVKGYCAIYEIYTLGYTYAKMSR